MALNCVALSFCVFNVPFSSISLFPAKIVFAQYSGDNATTSHNCQKLPQCVLSYIQHIIYHALHELTVYQCLMLATEEL